MCSIIQGLEWQVLNAPLLGEVLAHGWRDVEEVNGI